MSRGRWTLGMSRFEVRIVLILISLVFAGACSQVMTFNRLTWLGAVSCSVLVAGALLSEIVGRLLRKEWLMWIGPVCALLCLVIALLYTFAPPRPDSGLFVDTSHAWERYGEVRVRRD